MSAWTPLSFIDHSRMAYANMVRPRGDGGDFIIGDHRGEFMIELHYLDERFCSPKLTCFSDGVDALKSLLVTLRTKGKGLDWLLADVKHSADFSRRLIELGLRDASEKPL